MNVNPLYVPLVADATTRPAPVNAKPSIVKLVALVGTEITPLMIASAALSLLCPLTPRLGPTIDKLATETVTDSSHSPARIIILSPSLATAKASAIVAYA